MTRMAITLKAFAIFGTAWTLPALASSVNVVPDTGIAVVGIASGAIANVAANDTVGGEGAVPGRSGNATLSQVGTWPSGIQLNPSTGAVGVMANVAMGTYSFQYQLCDKASPTTCAVGTDTVTVIAAVVAAPEAGSAIVGTASTAIGNIIANDLVAGKVPTLGASGNATVATNGIWPAGFSLNKSTGAITVTNTVSTGSYELPYELCNKATPRACSTATDNIIVLAGFPEVQASLQYVYGDIEFDWARDGVYCAACNDGLSNSQVNWTDQHNNLWVNGINFRTGLFSPGNGQETLVDDTAFFWKTWGNGPEWAFSTPVAGQPPISQLVYSRYLPGFPATAQYAGAAFATVVDGPSGPAWQVNFFPEAISPGNNTVLPQASQCNADQVSLAVFKKLSDPQEMFIEPVSTASGTKPQPTPFGSFASGLAERWIACTHQLTFQGNVTLEGHSAFEQVFWYDSDSNIVQQLTFDPTTKARAVLFKAPDFPDSLGRAKYVLMDLAQDENGNSTIQLYLQNGTATNGAPAFQLINTLRSPDPTQPYMYDPKAFIHCTPQCRTFIVMSLSSTRNSQQTETDANGLGVANIDPATPFFEVLASSAKTQRFDPEYFITAFGPAVYYNRANVRTKTQPFQNLGIYFIDMQLGMPRGNCVGSSADGGLTSTWPNC